MGPYSVSYSSLSPYTRWGSLCRNKSSLQEGHVTRTNTRNCMFRGVQPHRAAPGCPSSSAMLPANQLGSPQPPASLQLPAHHAVPCAPFFHLPALRMAFQPSPHPATIWLIVAVDPRALSPPRVGEQLSGPGSERANSSFPFFFPSVSSEVTLRANGVSQLVWFIWFNVPPRPLGLAWPFIQAL